MPRMLIVLAALVTLALPLSTSSEDATNLDMYLNSLTDKKVDIVFVFDTSNSMGGEINELRAIANKFAADLEASHIDYNLGLVEFRDFPVTCGEGKKVQCGSPGDFAYVIKGSGTLTSEISTFNSWLEELEAGGGGSGGPEAILAALRHAGSDIFWREDAEKEIILLTDAGPHSDGSCCNAEGDTLEGTIFGLMHLGARANIIGPDDESLKRIAKDTGGQFFEIRSGLSLKPLLEKITAAMSNSFTVTADVICENGILKAKVQLVGKETIPYLSGQTDVWMYLKQAGNRSRYNLSYDQALSAYESDVPDACGPVDLSIYGRVGESSAVQTIQVDCVSCVETSEVTWNAKNPNSPPVIAELLSDRTSPQDAGAVIKCTANAFDPDGDMVLYRFFVDDNPASSWITENTWIWTANEVGLHRIEVRVRDAEHAGPNGLDDRMTESFTITEPKSTTPENQPPIINDLVAEQDKKMNITWTANLTDADSDEIFARYFLNNKSMTNWTTDIKWTLNAKDSNVGNNQVMVQVRDGKHEGPDSYDDAKSVQFNLSSAKLMVNTWIKILDKLNSNSVLQASDGGYVILGNNWVMKTDSNGNRLWFETFDIMNDGKEIQETSDGGYIIAEDSGLIKIDSDGNKIWNKTFEQVVESVQQTEDGGYIAAGHTVGNPVVWLLKTDANGNKLWDKTFGGSYGDWAHSVQQTNDGGYILSGSTFSYDRGYDKTWLIKTYPSGNEEWDRILPGTSGGSVRQTNDGGYILSGGPYSSLIKTDPLGNEEWHKFSDWSLGDVQQTSDGGYIITGTDYSSSNVTLLIKVDSFGNMEWRKPIGVTLSSSVQQTIDGGYIIEEYTLDRSRLIKTEANGNF